MTEKQKQSRKQKQMHPAIVAIGVGRFHVVDWEKYVFALESTRGGFRGCTNVLELRCHSDENGGNGHKYTLMSRYRTAKEYAGGFGEKTVCPRCFHEGKRAQGVIQRTTGNAALDAFLASQKKQVPPSQDE